MVSRVAPVLAFLAVTFTLGTRAPDASLTTPESVAVVVCPNTAALARSVIRVASNKLFLLVIFYPPIMRRRSYSLRVTQLRNRSIAFKRLDKEGLRRLDDLRYIAPRFHCFMKLYQTTCNDSFQTGPDYGS